MPRKKVPIPATIRCPECGEESGKISKCSWFCHECCIEIHRYDGVERLYQINEKGDARLISKRGITR